MNESDPLISVIIPTYNRAQLLRETLNSILAQTYNKWECIVVDDGSVDNSSDLLAEFCSKDSRFKYHPRPAEFKPGGNGARNYGFKISKGDYINWFDSDDLMLPDKLETQIALLHNSSFDYTICQSLMVDMERDKIIGLRAKAVFSNNIFQDFISFKIFWLTQAPLWRRSFLEKNHLEFNEDLKQSQDYDFHIRVLAISENYNFTEIPLLKVRYHDDNMSISMVQNTEKLKSNLFVKQQIFENYRKRINLETKRTVFSHMFVIYRQSVFSGSFRKTFISYLCLLNHISKIGLPFRKQFLIMFKTTLSSCAYLLFKKGYSHLKLKF